jgi:antitoxin component YwqK of YwqJK toxin-antitoxin module
MTDIKPYNKKGQAHGYWEQYYDNGGLLYKGHYHNGRRIGYWERYYKSGNIDYKGNYDNDKMVGYWEFYSNGELIEQIFCS